MNRSRWLGLAGCTGAALVGHGAETFAQDYPNRAVRMVVPYAAGGGVDIVTRAVAARLSERFGVQFVVDNRPGGSSNIGSELVARATPDGYTLLTASPANATNMSLFAKPPYDVTRDLAAVSSIGSVANVLAVHPSLPVRSVKELIALAKARPGQLTYSTGGSGSAQHLAGELLRSMAGIDIVHVAYRGGVPAALDVMSGQVTMTFSNVLEAVPHVRSGRMHALATTSARRASSLPGVPTVAEAGLPGYEVSVWWGIMAPAATPRPVIDRLNAEIARALESPEVRERLTGLGAEIRGSTPDELAAFVRNEVAKWAKVVRESGIKPD